MAKKVRNYQKPWPQFL